MDDQLLRTVRNEIEYILNDDAAGEVRVTYGDGHSEIKDAKVLLVDDLVHLFEGYAKTRVGRTEKAFGGCAKCYGKGYATALDFTHGVNTDWDIGGKGEVIHRQNPVMRYCSCDRGKQLQQLVDQSAPKGNPRLSRGASTKTGITDPHPPETTT